MPKGVVTPTTRVIIHAHWLAITEIPSHFGWHSGIEQLNKRLSRATITVELTIACHKKTVSSGQSVEKVSYTVQMSKSLLYI